MKDRRHQPLFHRAICWGALLSCLLLALSGCAAVTVAGAVTGAAVSVAGAVVSTGVSVTGKVIGKAIDVALPDDAAAQE